MSSPIIDQTNLISLVQNTLFTVIYTTASFYVFCTLRAFLDRFSFIMIFINMSGFAGKTFVPQLFCSLGRMIQAIYRQWSFDSIKDGSITLLAFIGHLSAINLIQFMISSLFLLNLHIFVFKLYSSILF